MIKNFIFLAFIVAFLSHSAFGQEENKTPPIIYKIQSNITGVSSLSVTDALTNTAVTSFSLPLNGNKIELSKDKNKAFINAILGTTNSNAPGLVMLDLRQGNIKGTFNGEAVYRAKLSPDNILWVLLGNENKIVLLNPDNLTPINIINNVERPTDIVFSPDGSKAYVSESTLTFSNIIVSIGVFDTKSLALIGGFNPLPPTSSVIQRPKELAISPDGNILCIVTKKTVTFIDTKSLNMTGSFDFPNQGVFDLAQLFFSPDGNTLYIAEIGRNLYSCDITTKIPNNIFSTDPFTAIDNLQFTSDGSLIYVGHSRGRYILDSKTNKLIVSVREDSLGNDIALAGDFSIGEPPSLQTTMPTASQQVMTNQPFTISWQTVVQPQSFSIASHKIEISTDGGMTFNVIPGAEQLKADAQSFTWQVPDIETTKAQIKISALDIGARTGFSTTGNFSISRNGNSGDTQAPSVSFLSPKGGEKFNSGDTLQITWTSSDNVGVTSQDLTLSTDGGSSFPVTLGSGLSGATQNFTYQLPMLLQSDQTRLRLVVRDAAGNSSQAITANNFSIVLGADTIPPTVVISEPNQSQSIIAGQPIQVKWQSTDNRAVVSQALSLSFDNGKTFTQIMGFGGTDNSFVLSGLDKLNLTTPQAMVKITAMDGTGNKGEANSLFTISPAITMGSYQAKTLSIIGIGFMSNVNNTVKLFVNDKEVTLPPSNVSNSSFSLKGNKKKLGILKGSNTVKLVIDGVMSNDFTFSF